MGEPELRKEIAQLRAEMERVDNWANGLLLVLMELLPPLLKKNPDIAAQLADSWRKAAEGFERGGKDELEARKILYRNLDLIGVWPAPGRE